jgi:dephospho-CoA kinase
LNKKYLSSIVFVDTYKLDKLNAIVHPVAIEAALQWAAKQHAPYIIKEAALLFEAGSANNLDFISWCKRSTSNKVATCNAQR